jgi:dTDP-glucose 4,6-dehydratase
MRLLVTGGAGFIGSNFARYWLREHPDDTVHVLDKLTYAGNPENLADIAGNPRYSFQHGDICDAEASGQAVSGCDVVVHFAAETHVDRSILSAGEFIRTDVHGTYILLQAARQEGVRRFVHISTDEVYGTVLEGASVETDPLMPSNPYSASKAGADRMAYAFWFTYETPVIITRGSNTYGPNQYPEKLVPFFVARALRGETLPVYGDGRQVRDWLHVEDHCGGIEAALERGTPGEVYNIGGECEKENLETIRVLLDELGRPESLIEFVADRPGHDRRYALNCGKLRALGWAPQADWEPALRETVRWYAEHQDWVERSIERGRRFFEQWYAQRGWSAS